MGFLKKIIFGGLAFVLILWGGAGTQSKSILLQGGGFLGLIAGLVILFIFLKMVWRAMGCLPSLLIFVGIGVFIFYAIGIFRDGPSGIMDNLKTFLGQGVTAGSEEESFASQDSEQQENVTIGETFSSPEASGQTDTFQKLIDGFSSAGKQKRAESSNPWKDLPIIESPVKVVSGDTLKIKKFYFKIYGIDAPELNQTCSDFRGQAYNCGRQSARWLKDWIMNSALQCRIMKKNAKGNMIGTCSYGPYDVGAALVNAGWALANTHQTKVYVPYEEQARDNRRGLWQGKFYRPEDWRKAQKLKPKIKIIKEKEKKKGAFFSF